MNLSKDYIEFDNAIILRKPIVTVFISDPIKDFPWSSARYTMTVRFIDGEYIIWTYGSKEVAIKKMAELKKIAFTS